MPIARSTTVKGTSSHKTTTHAITTPTIYTNLPSATHVQNKSLPAAAIAGSTIGGAGLAVVAVVAWMIWRKIIQRTKTKREREAVRDRVDKEMELTTFV